jgi:hypothetical protein
MRIKQAWKNNWGRTLPRKYRSKTKLGPAAYITDKDIKSGLAACYGAGEARRLWPGEAALIFGQIDALLDGHDRDIANSSSHAVTQRVLHTC